MTGPSYPARTIIEMARIPADAWPRFLAEMPAILAVVAPVVALYDEMRAAGREIPDSAYDALVAKFDWIDDDKGTVDINVVAKTDGGDVLLSKHHFNIPSAAVSE